MPRSAPRAKSPGIGRPLSDLRAVADRSDAKLDALIEATTALTRSNELLAQLLAHPPVVVHSAPRTADVIETLGKLGQIPINGRPVDAIRPSAHFSGVKQGCPDHPFDTWRRADGSLFCNRGDCRWEGYVGAAFVDEDALADEMNAIEGTERPVPRGTDPAPAPAFDPMADMRAELAEMAAEDDEPPPPPDEGEVWERRLSTFLSVGMWHPNWGPRPGQEGCLVPYEMMNAGR